jgi:hypothetical protein
VLSATSHQSTRSCLVGRWSIFCEEEREKNDWIRLGTTTDVLARPWIFFIECGEDLRYDGMNMSSLISNTMMGAMIEYYIPLACIYLL